MSLPRPEYPRPQFERKDWVNLNGPWSFTFDHGKSGEARGLAKSTGFDQTITVPFCVESRLSGVGHTDFVEALWYHRKIQIPAAWAGKKILLHFGGVEDDATVYVDGARLLRHVGGSAPFSVDLTASVKPGQTHDLVLGIKDEIRAGNRPGGKQSVAYKSAGCHYTRVTGIWQTVWMEAVDPMGLESVHIVPDLDGGRFIVTPTFHAVGRGGTWQVTVRGDGKAVTSAKAAAVRGNPIVLNVGSSRPWSPADPFLYDLDFEVLNEKGQVLDRVSGYAGLRKIHIEGNRMFLNNEPVYQRLVLDQGFYPEGIWTAPTDGDLKRDIELSMKAGFNGARLHQKAFEERFHYWADKMGYLTWAESPSWGLDTRNPLSARAFFDTWATLVVRDRNHPSVIAWSPLNETEDEKPGTPGLAEQKRMTREIARLTRSLDVTRPVNDASGYNHVDTDLWTVHNYVQDPAEMRKQLAPVDGKVWVNRPHIEETYGGQPYLVDEFGGILWVPGTEKPFADNTWGYGRPPQSLDEFYDRLAGQVQVLLDLAHIEGYCYTQLTDVEQEQNGIYTYDRREKFDMKKIHGIFSKTPNRK